MKYLSPMVLLFLISFSMKAQSDECIAAPNSQEVSFMNIFSVPDLPGMATTDNFPIAVYVIKSSSNMTSPVSQSTFETELVLANAAFNQAYVNFNLLSFDEVVDDSLYINDPDHPNQKYWYPYRPDVINIYFVESFVESDPGITTNGYSTYPSVFSTSSSYSEDRIFMRYSVADNGSTLMHQLGHFFGLYHTHYETACPMSCAGGECGLNLLLLFADCDGTSDRCCDTGIDPKLPIYDENNCTDDPTCTNFTFQSVPFTNYMSYYGDCRVEFSDDQRSRIYHYSNNGRPHISNNALNDNLVLLSPAYGSYEGYIPRDIHFYNTDIQSVPVNLSYREVGGSWITIEEDILAAPGYNVFTSTFTPLYFGAGTGNFEFRVQNAANNSISDVGSPITVNSINDHPDIDPSLSLVIGCLLCIGGEDVNISWTLAGSELISLYYTLDGGITWDPIVEDIVNTQSYTWTLPDCRSTNNFAVSLFRADGTTFDIAGFLGLDAPFDLQDGLLAHYPFNGNANDISGNNYHGVVTGATLTDDRFCTPNAAYSFDGVDDYIEVHEYNGFNTLTFTVSAWVKHDTSQDDPEAVVCYGEDQDIDKMHYGIISQNNQYRGWYELIIDDGDINIFGDEPDDGVWQHILIKRNEAGKFSMHLNGVEIASRIETQTSPFLSNTPLFVGRRSNSLMNNPDIYQDYYTGKIDDVRVYNRAVTCIELDSLYREGCNNHITIANKTFMNDTTIVARGSIEISNVSVDAPNEVFLRTPKVIVSQDSDVKNGARMEVVNQNACICDFD